MQWDSLSITRLLLLGLLGTLPSASAEPKGKAEGGSPEGLAYEAINKDQIYTDNATAPATQTPPVQGWWHSKICAGEYCIFTNRRLAKGRGLVAVTREDELETLEKYEELMSRGENKYFEDPAPYVETTIPETGGLGLVANKTIRRGKQLMSFTPVMLVHAALFDDVPKRRDRTRILEKAAAFLPPGTLATFNKLMRAPLRAGAASSSPKPRSIESLLQAHPFEVDLGFAHPRAFNPAGAEDPDGARRHSRHYAVYPEASRLQHDCRPNVAWYQDRSFALHLTVARKVAPGEELTISYIDPFLSREERNKWVGRYRMKGKRKEQEEEGRVENEERKEKKKKKKKKKGCSCKACNPPGGEAELVKGDERLKEILEIRAELRNHDSVKVTVPMIERFVKLVEEDRLNAKLAEPYELAALNFNYLGEDKKAKKYADLAVQAGIVEGGIDSNDVIAMRIMANDIKGHYSYQYTLKRRGKVPK